MSKSKATFIYALIFLIGILGKSEVLGADNYKIIEAPNSFDLTIPSLIDKYYIIIETSVQTDCYVILNTSWDNNEKVTISSTTLSQEVDVENLDSYTYQNTLNEYTPIQEAAKATKDTKYVIFKLSKSRINDYEFSFTASFYNNWKNIIDTDSSYEIDIPRESQYYYFAIKNPKDKSFGYITLFSEWSQKTDVSMKVCKVNQDVDFSDFSNIENLDYQSSTELINTSQNDKTLRYSLEKTIRTNYVNNYIIFRINKGTTYGFTMNFKTNYTQNYYVMGSSSTYDAKVPNFLKTYYIVVENTKTNSYGYVILSGKSTTSTIFTFNYTTTNNELNEIDIETLSYIDYTKSSTSTKTFEKSIRTTDQIKYAIFKIASSSTVSRYTFNTSFFINYDSMKMDSFYQKEIPGSIGYYYVIVENKKEDHFGYVSLFSKGGSSFKVDNTKSSSTLDKIDCEKLTYSNMIQSISTSGLRSSIRTEKEDNYAIFRIYVPSSTLKFTFNSSFYFNYITMDAKESKDIEFRQSINYYYVIIKNYQNTTYKGVSELRTKDETLKIVKGVALAIESDISNLDYEQLDWGSSDGVSLVFSTTVTEKNTYVIFRLHPSVLEGNHTLVSNHFVDYVDMKVLETKDVQIKSKIDYYYIFVQKDMNERAILYLNSSNITSSIDKVKSSKNREEINVNLLEGWEASSSKNKSFVDFKSEDKFAIFRLQTGTKEEVLKLKTSYIYDYLVTTVDKYELVQSFDFFQYFYIFIENKSEKDGFYSLDLISSNIAISEVKYGQSNLSPKDFDYSSLNYIGQSDRYESIVEAIAPNSASEKNSFQVFRIKTNSIEGEINAMSRFNEKKTITQDISLGKNRTISPEIANYNIIVPNQLDGYLIFYIMYESEYKEISYAFSEKEKYEIIYHLLDWQTSNAVTQNSSNLFTSTFKIKSDESSKFVVYRFDSNKEDINSKLIYKTQFIPDTISKSIKVGNLINFIPAINNIFYLTIVSKGYYVNIEIKTSGYTLDILKIKKSGSSDGSDTSNWDQVDFIKTMEYKRWYSVNTTTNIEFLLSLPSNIVNYDSPIYVWSSQTKDEPSIFNFAYVIYIKKFTEDGKAIIPINKYGLYVISVKEEMIGVTITLDNNFGIVPEFGIKNIREELGNKYLNNQIKDYIFSKCSPEATQKELSISIDYKDKEDEEKGYNLLVFAITKEEQKNKEITLNIKYIQESSNKAIIIVVSIIAILIIGSIAIFIVIHRRKLNSNDVDFSKKQNLNEIENLNLGTL